MYIFFDTNIFYKHWHAKNADFNLFFNYIENSRSTLLVSDLVCEEIENGHDREFKVVLDKLKSELIKANNFNEERIEYDFEKLNQPYSFKGILEERVKLSRLKYISYDDVKQSEVVTRAVKILRPFQEDDKGYRDTLIWLSFLYYIKENKIKGEIAFINNNKGDFYSADDKTIDFHPGLKKDIERIVGDSKIIPYESLSSFIAHKIVKEENQFTRDEVYEKYLDSIDRIIEGESEFFINDLSASDFSEVLVENSWRSFAPLNNIIRHNFKIDEGVEDPEVLGFKVISKDLIYINYRYNLRRCTLYITISRAEYLASQSEFDRNFDVEAGSRGEVTFAIYVRTYLDASFNYNISENNIEGFTIENIEFK